MIADRIYMLLLMLMFNTDSFCSTDTIFDKSNIFFQDSLRNYAEPYDIKTIRLLIQDAIANKQRIIIQGRRHSANGSSLGGKNEILLNTIRLNNIKILSDRVVVGSGVVIEELDVYLRENGFQLVTKNDGGKGPTVGGLISAGGVGRAGDVGFWETVLKINLMDGKGKLVSLTPQDKDFKWLFGSMGQLGVIYETEIKIIKLEDNNVKPESDSGTNSIFKNNYFYWFPFFAECNKKDTLKSLLDRLNVTLHSLPELSNINISVNDKSIDIKFKKFNPPLLVNFNSDISAYGLKVFISKSDSDFITKIRKIRSEVDSFILKYAFKSYFQVSYYEQNKKNIQQYLGIKEYDFFEKLKKKYDPDTVFGKVIF